MKNTTHIESFGSFDDYAQVIMVVYYNREWWRKTARMLNKLRLQLRPWPHVDRESQRIQANKDAIHSLRDTRLPSDVIENLKKGMEREFQFKF